MGIYWGYTIYIQFEHLHYIYLYFFVYRVVWQTPKINHPYYHKWIVKTIPILWY